ncbi:MAG: hypothetical protein JNL09_00500 [Anaerolineales bacterium]|nr:hypothetical protein [Anaerolineales bacterium]
MFLTFALLLTACVDEQTIREFEAVVQTEEAAARATELAANVQPPTRTPRPATAVPPTRPPATTGGGGGTITANPNAQTWTILLYQNADDEVLEQDIFIDLNEAEAIGSTDRVNIVSQIDRFAGGYRGGGNWTSTRRYFVTQDNDLYNVGSEMLAEGESNMADGDVLVDFIKWGVQNYPADKYVLILSDHGMGWPGGWNDPTANGSGPDRAPIARVFGDLLYLNELDRSLERAIRETGIGQFELLGFDACLMAHVEVFAAIQPYARYAVASQEVEPGLGWAYAAFLNDLVNKPEMDGRELSQKIVEHYITSDLRIINDQAREDYTGRRVSAQAVINATAANATLSAVDLSQMPAVLKALDDFAVVAGELDPRFLARTRTYSQAFQSVFGEEVPPSYIDMAHFAALTAQEAGDAGVTQAAQGLLAAMQQAIVVEASGPERPGAYGMSIYFPNSQLFRNPLSGYESYTTVARRFAENSLWDDFLVAHYTGKQLTRSVTIPTPPPDVAIVSPGAEEITAAPIKVSSKTATLNQPVTLSTAFTGESISYIYLFVGYYDEAKNAILVADEDFIEGDDTRAVDGVAYPVWNGNPVPLEFEWEPTLFAIDDGAQVVQALLSPEDYGASADDATYSTEGYYVFSESGQKRFAKIIWGNDGNLRAIFGFTGTEDEPGAPSEITPETGDQFILINNYYDIANDDYYSEEGAVLTFGDELPTWTTIDAPAGLYNVGFIAEDFDGNYAEVYTDIQVR